MSNNLIPNLKKIKFRRQKYSNLFYKSRDYINKIGPKVFDTSLSINQWLYWITPKFIKHGNSAKSERIVESISKKFFIQSKVANKVYWIIQLPPSHKKSDYIYTIIREKMYRARKEASKELKISNEKKQTHTRYISNNEPIVLSSHKKVYTKILNEFKTNNKNTWLLQKEPNSIKKRWVLFELFMAGRKNYYPTKFIIGSEALKWIFKIYFGAEKDIKWKSTIKFNTNKKNKFIFNKNLSNTNKTQSFQYLAKRIKKLPTKFKFKNIFKKNKSYSKKKMNFSYTQKNWQWKWNKKISNIEKKNPITYIYQKSNKFFFNYKNINFSTKKKKNSYIERIYPQNEVFYKIKVIKYIDETSKQDYKFLLVERKYNQVNYKEAFEDIFNMLTPNYKFFIEVRGEGLRRYQNFSKRWSDNLKDRSKFIIRWLKEQVNKNKKYEHLIRNPKKSKPKPKVIFNPKTSKRINVTFDERLNTEFEKIFTYQTDFWQKLNDFDTSFRSARQKKHFRWKYEWKDEKEFFVKKKI